MDVCGPVDEFSYGVEAHVFDVLEVCLCDVVAVAILNDAGVEFHLIAVAIIDVCP